MQITVLGKGAFGKAIGSLLDENRIDFAYVDVNLPMKKNADLVFITVPTQFIRDALIANKKFFTPGTVFVNCAKGIEQKTYKLPFQIIQEVISPKYYYCIVGPSFAEEVVLKHPTLVSLGYKQKKYVDILLNLLKTSYFRIQPTKGYEGLELSASLKNVYAIVCGFASGLGYGMNTRAKLITIALQEITEIADAMGFAFASDILPGVVGDLVLTCSSEQSRNFTFGTLLAKMPADEALVKAGSTVEGYYTSRLVKQISDKFHLKMPLALLTQEVIAKGKNAKTDFHAFVSLQ